MEPAPAPVAADRLGAAAAVRPLHVCIVVGEESGDQLGASLMRALRARSGENIRFSGVGGLAMAAEGLPVLFPLTDVALVGFGSVLKGLRRARARIRQTAAMVIDGRPDVLVIVDSPDFTHWMARRVRARAPAIPIVDYVSPSVWAWRPWRARAMRRYVDHVMALLPFEPAAHRRLGGPPCTYVGHPLIERVAALRPSSDEARRRLQAPPLLLLLPGSRRSEVRRLLGVFGETLQRVGQAAGPVDIALPTLPHLAEAITAGTANWPQQPRLVFDAEAKHQAFRNARAALAASGTVTLELALAGVPMVAAYRVGRIEEMIVRSLINVSSAILANLVLGENVVPEFYQGDCVPETLAGALLPLLGDTPQRQAQLAAFARLDGIMEIGTARPSERAADIVLAHARRTSP